MNKVERADRRAGCGGGCKGLLVNGLLGHAALSLLECHGLSGPDRDDGQRKDWSQGHAKEESVYGSLGLIGLQAK